MRLKALSYNIHSCFGMDRAYDVQRVLDVLIKADADVIGLQEVDSSLEVFDGIDQLTFLANNLGMFAVQGPTLKRGYGAYGNAILSRYPLLDVFEEDLTYRRFEPRGLLQARIDIDGVSVTAINTHLGLKSWERRFQIDLVLRRAMRHEDPLILMGDFNEWNPWSKANRLLGTRFGAVPLRKTFPAVWPRFSLDRIYVSPPCQISEIRVLTDSTARVASDHLPLLADVVL